MKYSLATTSLLSLVLIACPTSDLSTVAGSGPGQTDEDVRPVPDRAADVDAGHDVAADATSSADIVEVGGDLADAGGLLDLAQEDPREDATDASQPPDAPAPDVPNDSTVADEETGDGNLPPSPVITLPPDPIVIGDAVEFSGADSSDEDGSIVSYDWRFRLLGSPEVTSNSGMRVTESFDVWGTHEAILVVSDDDSAVVETTETFDVLSPPTAAIDLPDGAVAAGEELSISGASSTDVDGEVVLFEWELGDESSDTGEVITHTYDTVGLYDVTLVITDDDGLTDTSTAVLNVGNVNTPPVAQAGPDRTAEPGEALSFDASESTDNGEIIAVRWDFGDDESAFTATTTHAWADAGTYTVTLTVEDDGGLLDEDTADVVVNTPPVAAFDVLTTELVAGEPISFSGTSSYDPDGDVLAGYDWDFGDAGTASGASTSHTYGAEGSYTVMLTVRDPAGATGLTEKVITVAPAGSGTIDGLWRIRSNDADDLLYAECLGWTMTVGPATCEVEQIGSAVTMRCGDAVYTGTRTGDDFDVSMRRLLISDPSLLDPFDPNFDLFWLCGDIYAEDRMTGTFVTHDHFEAVSELSMRFDYEGLIICIPCYFEDLPKTGRKL